MDMERASLINDHLESAFDHLREAIMLSIAGKPSEQDIGGAMGRLEKFVESGGDVNTLTEGLFDGGPFSTKVEPVREYEDAPLTPSELVQAAADLGAIIAPDPETGLDTAFLPIEEDDIPDDEEDEFSGLFDDIDEAPEPDDESDAPAAF